MVRSGSIAMHWASLGRRLVVLCLAAFLSASCATAPDDETNDPLEGLNRHVFAFNDAVDTMVVRPAAFVYREAMPSPFKDMISNFLDNLTLPLTIIHDLLQGKPERAQVAATRLFLNTTVGMWGLFDIATPTGYVLHEEDMGQTLAVHGVGEGPYLVLPLLGPSSVRDAGGTLLDWLLDPVSIATYGASNGQELRLGRAGASGLVEREQLMDATDALRQSIDYYATVRSAYRQRRAVAIRDGAPDPNALQNDPFADFDNSDVGPAVPGATQ